jgi:hypothetical protein
MALEQLDNVTQIERTILGSLRRAEHARHPYDYWLLEDALPPGIMREIIGLPFPQPNDQTFDGRRESNNSTRVYFSPDNQSRFPVCRDVAAAFRAPELIATLERLTGAPLSGGQLRIEYCQDADGFWLEPHVDIKVKLISILLYLSPEPELADAGTDIYADTPDHAHIGATPFGPGKGLIFVPSHNTWHGFEPRPIHGIRRLLSINYVTQEWRAREELC